MPQLLPFHGLRPVASVVGSLDDVVCPPYDVITEDQRLELAARSPYNVVRVELPAGEYEQAARLLSDWRREGAFAEDPEPALYGYRMTSSGPSGERRSTVGVIGALVLEQPGEGILPHEQTTPKAKSDRLELIRATHANTSPIWCLCTEHNLVEALSGTDRRAGEVAQVVDGDGNTHELWPVLDPHVHAEISKSIASSPLLVADGHHRYETALAYRSEGGPEASEGPSAVLALVVELSEQHLQVLAIHRVVSGLREGYDVTSVFAADFDLVGTNADGAALFDQMTASGAVGIVTAAGSWLARPREGTPSASYALDSSRADSVLSGLPPHELRYEHDVAEAMSAVRKGEASAAVFCRPATVDQIASTARGGARMPPKTTFFWPKPRTGLVMRAW